MKLRTAAKYLLLLAIYIVACKLGLKLAEVNKSSTVIWPGTGLAIGFTLLYGSKTLPIWFLGALVTNLGITGELLPSIIIAVGNTTEAYLGWWFIQRSANGRNAFDSPDTTFQLVGIVAIAATISASIGTYAVAGFSAWFIWWAGDVLGALLLIPLITYRWNKADWSFTSEKLAFFLVIIGFSVLVYTLPISVATAHYVPGFVIALLFLWPATRLGSGFTRFSLIVPYFIALYGTTKGLGEYGSGTVVPNERLFSMQLFFAGVMITVLVLSALVAHIRSTPP